MKFCPDCGARLSDGVKFCTECGAKILPPAPPVYEPPVEPAYVPPAPPVYEPPVEPAYEPPTPPVYEPPVEPAYVPPAPPIYEPPVEPAKKPPVYTPQVKEKPAKPPREKKPIEKKPLNKKTLLFAAIGVAVLVVIVLLASLLGGKNQGEQADWGRYEAVSAKADGEWIELGKKGKATLYVMDNEFKAKWKLDGEKFILEQSGDTYTGTLKNGTLQINLVGTDYLFVKEDAVTGPVTYKAVACVSAGQILDEELMDVIGGCYLVMNGDGTGKLHLFGDIMDITYTDTTVSVDGETMDYTWKGETMVLNFADGSSFDLVVTDEDPADATVSEFEWEEDPEPETEVESEPESEILTYLKWPGQTFSDLDLSNATLTLWGSWGEGMAWFRTGPDGSVVESMDLYVNTISHEDLRELLVSAYGEPTDEGEEPYVESVGGVVSFCWFDYPAGTLQLVAAEDYDFVQILATAN